MKYWDKEAHLKNNVWLTESPEGCWDCQSPGVKGKWAFSLLSSFFKVGQPSQLHRESEVKFPLEMGSLALWRDSGVLQVDEWDGMK